MYAAQIDSLPVEELHASSQPHTLREGATANRLSEAGQLASNSVHPYGSHAHKGRKANNGYHTFKESQLHARKSGGLHSEGQSNDGDGFHRPGQRS